MTCCVFGFFPRAYGITAYAKLAPDGAQTSNAVIASAVRICESLARSYYRYFLFFLRFFMYISYRSNI